ncbi:unnamed protein product [Polarella glacialis]|uniref:Hexose transporter 1 n=1 Tax=Polarella glacialis TaxID=89957 RepID=A0A813D507_POLGL|nr:unnamed protein product [Polarella glacialis]
MGQHSTATAAALVASLGAFLFGLDIGYIAPIMSCAGFKRDVAQLPDWSIDSATIAPGTLGFIVGIFSLGAIVTSFPTISSYFLDVWGRRSSVILGSWIFLLGCGLQAGASSVARFLLGRFVTGISIGLLSSVVPLYQAEMSPPHLRGSLTVLYNLMITAGIFVAAIADQLLVQREGGWRIAIALQAVPAVFILTVMPLLPRSPRWLVQQGRQQEAEATLLELRAPQSCAGDPEQAQREAEARKELREIVAEHEADWAQSLGEGDGWDKVFSGRTGALVFLGASLQMLQQLVGMNAFMYFGPRIFSSFGLDANLLQTMLTGANFLATLPAVLLVESSGRRPLLVAGAAAMTGACFMLGSLGLRYMRHTDEGWVATDDSVGGAMVVLVFAFVMSFACTWGPVVWVYCAEIFPLKHRARCIGVTTMTNWVGNFVIAQFTPFLLDIAGFSTFFLFGFFCFLALLLALWLPETSGVPLEQIGHLFDANLGSPLGVCKSLEASGYGAVNGLEDGRDANRAIY